MGQGALPATRQRNAAQPVLCRHDSAYPIEALDGEGLPVEPHGALKYRHSGLVFSVSNRQRQGGDDQPTGPRR